MSNIIQPLTSLHLSEKSPEQDFGQLKDSIIFLSNFPQKNPAPVFSVNNNDELIYFNQSAKPLLNDWLKKYHALLPDHFFEKIYKVLVTRQETIIEESWQDNHYLFSITLGAPGTVNLYGTNITELKKTQDELIYLSNHDVLTGLYNRNAFDKALRQAIVDTGEHQQMCGILLIDLDDFKSINDSFGHHVGDELLITVGRFLLEQTRKEDVVARLGGDVFAILMPRISIKQSAEKLAQSLLDRFTRPIKLENHLFQATISIGIAIAKPSETDSITLLKNADLALYHVKNSGRNNFKCFSDNIQQKFQRQVTLQSTLIDSLHNNDFYIVYQPQYQLPDNTISGLEALLRWHHPELGPVTPDEFIPISEKNGTIIELGLWVLENACREYMVWHKKGFIPKSFKLSINLSPVQLQSESFIASLNNILQVTNMPAKNLEFELTETAVMTNTVELDSILSKLRQMNISVAIDDFGTGYSSLSRLKDLHINTLKIDKSFVKDITTDKDHNAIVKSIIALGHSLNLKVITEGVETKQQLETISHHGCQFVQGFYFGQKPLGSNEVLKVLKKFSQR